jgi:two-component system sensor histidine kinase MtrB
VSRRRPLGLRARLVTTFALVAALVAVAVAGISYAVVRYSTLQRAMADAVREAQVHLDDAAATLGEDPRPAQLRRFVAQVEARSLADVVALDGDDSVTTSISLSEEAIPGDLRAAVDAGRVAAVRTVHSDEAMVVVGGAVRPAGPAFYFFFPQQDIVDDLALLARVLAGTSGVLVVISAVIGAAAASGVLRPIRRTRAAVRAVAAGDLEARLDEEGGDELAELARAFNTMTAALRRTVGELRELEAGQRRFVSDVSHELRTPLTALTTACEVLDANIDGLTDAGRRAARLVVVESRRLASLVEDLMEISRLDAGAADVTLERVDVTRSIKGALRSRGWDGQVDVRGDDGVTVYMDARRLDAIIGNLVGNARAYGRPPVTVTVRAGPDDVEVAVADHGDGIAPQHLPRVFDRFYKVDRSRSSGGTGLGLAIARENARLHGGDLRVASEEGRGTTFTLQLPRRRDQ